MSTHSVWPKTASHVMASLYVVAWLLTRFELTSAFPATVSHSRPHCMSPRHLHLRRQLRPRPRSDVTARCRIPSELPTILPSDPQFLRRMTANGETRHAARELIPHLGSDNVCVARARASLLDNCIACQTHPTSADSSTASTLSSVYGPCTPPHGDLPSRQTRARQ
jgi:hypothetical protein